jgi:hypothetical protein
MNIFQIVLLKSLEEQQAFCPANAVLLGKIKDNAKLPVSVIELAWARNKCFIESVKRNELTYYFLSKKGIEFLDNSLPNPTAKCTEEPQCPASVGGNIDPDMDDSMLNDVSITEPPEYDPAVVANQHTDAFINAINEKDYISGIVPTNAQVHFEVIDQNSETVGTFEDPFSAMNEALKFAMVGGQFVVEKVIVEKIGIAKPVTSSIWEFA